jgi:hypothetical protein
VVQDWRSYTRAETDCSPRSSSQEEDTYDVVEITLLLPAARVEALARVAALSGLTVGPLVRRVVGDFLRRLDTSATDRRSAGG